MFKLNARIDGMDIIDPSRKLLKEGKLEKLTTRNDLQDRYIFLVSDDKKDEMDKETFIVKELETRWIFIVTNSISKPHPPPKKKTK